MIKKKKKKGREKKKMKKKNLLLRVPIKILANKIFMFQKSKSATFPPS